MSDRNLTLYCAAPACDLNLAGWAHVPWDCDAQLPVPTMAAETIAALPVERRPWVQGSARAFAHLNPGLCPPREAGEELPGELASDPPRRALLGQQEAAAAIGERAEAGLVAENAAPDPGRRRAAIAGRVEVARLHALDRDLLLASLARLPEGSLDLSRRSVLDARFHAFLLSDHPAAVVERCRRRAAYLDDTVRQREGLLGWLARLDGTLRGQAIASTTQHGGWRQSPAGTWTNKPPASPPNSASRTRFGCLGRVTSTRPSGEPAATAPGATPPATRGPSPPASPSRLSTPRGPAGPVGPDIATGRTALRGPEGRAAMNADPRLTSAIGPERSRSRGSAGRLPLKGLDAMLRRRDGTRRRHRYRASRRLADASDRGPALRATFDPRELDSRDATRTQASTGLPDPAKAAARFALALCEVEAGMRPAAQLERAYHHSLYEKLEERVRRSGGPAVSVHSLVDIITQQQAPGLVDAVVLLHGGERVAAVTMRLDAAPGHWQVTELQYGRFPEPERANESPTRDASRPLSGHGSRAGEAAAGSARARCGSTLGGREALKHACTLPRGHQGHCSWWQWHQEQVARHEHGRRWRHHMSPPPFRLEDYRDFLAQRFPRSYRGQVPSARLAPARRPPERTLQRGGDGHER